MAAALSTRSGISAVDAIVVATAETYDSATVFTSDVGDLAALAARTAASAQVTVGPIPPAGSR